MALNLILIVRHISQNIWTILIIVVVSGLNIFSCFEHAIDANDIY